MTDKPKAVEEIIGLRISESYYGQKCLQPGTKSVCLAKLILSDLDVAGYEVKAKIPVEGKVS